MYQYYRLVFDQLYCFQWQADFKTLKTFVESNTNLLPYIWSNKAIMVVESLSGLLFHTKSKIYM